MQPYWRHLLEIIKRRSDLDTPDDSETHGNENADLRIIAEAAASSNDQIDEPDVSGDASDAPLVNLSELPSDSESESDLMLQCEDDPHGYPVSISIRSDCVYARDEVIRMDCWLHYR